MDPSAEPQNRPPGRPSKLTRELIEAFCRPIRRRGMHRRHAAALVGVDEVTISRWFTAGANEEEGLKREFFLAVTRAEALFARKCHKTLELATLEDPRAVQFVLSRRFPDLYGRKDNVELESAEDKASKAQQLRETIIERLAKLLPAPPAPVEPPPPPVEPPAAPPPEVTGA